MPLFSEGLEATSYLSLYIPSYLVQCLAQSDCTVQLCWRHKWINDRIISSSFFPGVRSLVWDMQSSDQGLTEFTHKISWHCCSSPLLPPHLLFPCHPSGHCHYPLPKQWEVALIKVLCPVQDWRKSNKLRECPEESNKNWLNRPSEERLRELGLFSARVAGGGNNKFSRNKRISCKTFFFF